MGGLNKNQLLGCCTSISSASIIRNPVLIGCPNNGLMAWNILFRFKLPTYWGPHIFFGETRVQTDPAWQVCNINNTQIGCLIWPFLHHFAHQLSGSWWSVKWGCGRHVSRHIFMYDMEVSINGGTPKVPKIIYFSGNLHYKPSIFGYPHLWAPPHMITINKWLLTVHPTWIHRATAESRFCVGCRAGHPRGTVEFEAPEATSRVKMVTTVLVLAATTLGVELYHLVPWSKTLCESYENFHVPSLYNMYIYIHDICTYIYIYIYIYIVFPPCHLPESVCGILRCDIFPLSFAFVNPWWQGDQWVPVLALWWIRHHQQKSCSDCFWNGDLYFDVFDGLALCEDRFPYQHAAWMCSPYVYIYIYINIYKRLQISQTCYTTSRETWVDHGWPCLTPGMPKRRSGELLVLGGDEGGIGDQPSPRSAALSAGGVPAAKKKRRSHGKAWDWEDLDVVSNRRSWLRLGILLIFMRWMSKSRK